MTSAKLLNYSHLWRSPWTVWLWLIVASALPMLILAFIISSSRCSGCGLSYNLWLFQPVLWIAAFLAIGGLLLGIARNINAKLIVGQAFNVSYVSATHPIAQRVHALADRLDLPRPEVGIMAAANAYAVGENAQQAAVILGLPLIKGLQSDELDAVIGHELGHIASGDMNRMQMALGYQSFFDGICRVIGFVFDLALSMAAHAGPRHAGAVAIGSAISKLLVSLTQVTVFFVSSTCISAMSRRREFYADAVGAMLTTTDAMQRALTKLYHLGEASQDSERAHQALMIRGAWLSDLWSTHPMLNARIEALAGKTYIVRLENRRSLDAISKWLQHRWHDILGFVESDVGYRAILIATAVAGGGGSAYAVLRLLP
jgi:heat shock protein HtpX